MMCYLLSQNQKRTTYMPNKGHIPKPILGLLRQAYNLSGKKGIPGLGFLLRTSASLFKPLRTARIPLGDERHVYLDLRDEVNQGYLLYGEVPFEENEIKFTKAVVHKGDIVIDGGAYVGGYATLFSKLVGPNGKVYAFEPNPHMYYLLSRTAEEYSNIFPQPYALAETEKSVSFYVPIRKQTWKAGIAPIEDAEHIQVQAVSIDSFIERENIHPDFIKLDVEGYELYVLQGATKLLASSKPPIWLLEAFLDYTKNRFGYSVNEYISFISEKSSIAYDFYMIGKHSDGKVIIPIENLPEKEGVVYYMAAVPEWAKERIKSLI